MKPDFAKLWSSYPSEQHPCDGAWDNQCAIRMSVALNAEGTIKINAMTYAEPKCAHGHARGAESLANYLWRAISRPKVYTDGAQAKVKIAGKNGIVFFKDCFTREGQVAALGDHIDLWRLGTTKTYSDPGNLSMELWFWELA